MPQSKRKVLYWEKAIADAKRLGAFTRANRDRASDWTTCACGTQDARIPRDEDTNWPLDFDLRTLGTEFYGFVHDGTFAPDSSTRERAILHAEATLRRIEQRAGEVLLAAGVR